MPAAPPFPAGGVFVLFASPPLPPLADNDDPKVTDEVFPFVPLVPIEPVPPAPTTTLLVYVVPGLTVTELLKL